MFRHNFCPTKSNPSLPRSVGWATSTLRLTAKKGTGKQHRVIQRRLLYDIGILMGSEVMIGLMSMSSSYRVDGLVLKSDRDCVKKKKSILFLLFISDHI